MIGKLKGVISFNSPDSLIIDVNGVGYLVYVPKNIISQSKEGESIELWVQTEVKQDDIQLYGFLSMEDKRWFNLLQSVQGVGAKVALNILGNYSVNTMVSAIIASDKMFFQRIGGIGPKLAQRILLEMADKLPKHIANSSINKVDIKTSDNNQSQLITAEATSALANLGFNRVDASNIISEVYANNPGIVLEELIRIGLKNLGKNKL